MKNLWPESFHESTLPSVKTILEEQASLLAKLTGDMVFAEVVEDLLSPVALTGKFSYRFNIIGKFLDNYKFRVMTFSHDITLYPIKFILDEQLGEELGIEPDPITGGHIMQIEDPEEVEIFLKSVLSSKRIQDVVGSILKLSK